MEQIQANQVAQWAQDAQAATGELQPVVLDVREAWELQQASIKVPQGCGFAHISMGTVPVRLSELNKNQAIACLCHHGGRSMQVAMFLENQGFSQVVNIAGGIDAWSVLVDPTIPRY
jgi:rhodanese-related sulfurtransferase